MYNTRLLFSIIFLFSKLRERIRIKLQSMCVSQTVGKGKTVRIPFVLEWGTKGNCCKEQQHFISV